MSVIDGDVENGSVMLGQSGRVLKCEQPAREIIDDLVSNCNVAFERLNQFRPA